MYVIPEFPVMQVSFEEFMGIFFVSEGLLNNGRPPGFEIHARF